jgi:hypothetical protein
MRFAEIYAAGSGATPSWRLVQVPLRFLKRNDGTGANLNYAELANRNFRLQAFQISGTWQDGTEVALDQSRVRW